MLDGLHGLIKLIYDSAPSSPLDGMIISGGKEDWKNI